MAEWLRLTVAKRLRLHAERHMPLLYKLETHHRLMPQVMADKMPELCLMNEMM